MSICYRFFAPALLTASQRRSTNYYLPGRLLKGPVFIWLLCCCLLTGSLHAQTGTWMPPGADLSYPRTLLKSTDVERVRESLRTPASQALYAGLYAQAKSAAPGDNTSAAGRRARATFAKNTAFIALLARQPTGTGLAPLPATERAALVTTTRALLESLNPNVEAFATWAGTTPYTEWQWRSKELIDYLIAYDLLRGAGETPASLAASQARLQEFAGNLYRQATTPFLGFTFYGTIKNNHTLMTAAALGMAAVVLNEASSTDRTRQPAAWAGAGLYHIDNVLWRDAQRQSDSTQVAGYAEGPYYCKYALLNCLPFFRALGNFLPDARQTYTYGASSRSIRNPYYDPKYARLYEWLTAIMLPDGRLPALADSYVDIAMPELALTGQPQYVRPLALSGLTGTPMNSLVAQLRDATVDMRAAYLAAALAPAPATYAALTALPASGDLIFRSGSDSLASYLHLAGRGGLAQANAGGHSQGDASNFLLYAHGQLLALDPGYLSYARRAEVGQATNHNLVLVDGAGPAIGTAGAASPASSTVQHALHTPQLSYGEVQTAYQGTSLVRKALFVRNTYYLLADDVRATAPHTYTWQLHGAGLAGSLASTGTFADSLLQHEGTWQKSGVRLLAHVTATGGATAYTTATNIHETTYNTAQNHTTLLVQKSGFAQTQFLAALYPHTGRAPRIRTTSGASTAALASTGAAYRDLAFAQADTLLQTDTSRLLPQVVRADGQLNFYSADSTGVFAQLFLEQGTVLYADTLPLVRASRRATLSWQKTSATRYDGSVSRATTLTLALATAPAAVTGAGVASYRYDIGRQQLRVVFTQPTAFAVELALKLATARPAPLPVVLTAFTARRVSPSRVALAWQTASEVNNQGVEVQRRGQDEDDFETLGFVPSRGALQQPASYSLEDATAPGTLVYYRLRQLDADGTATYSPVVTVARSTAGGTPLAWPQPAQHTLWVQFTGPSPESQLRLLDATGRVVRQLRFQQQTQLEVGSLAPGLYYLQALDASGQPLAPSQKVLLAP
jgi:hypothetical protein